MVLIRNHNFLDCNEDLKKAEDLAYLYVENKNNDSQVENEVKKLLKVVT